MKPAQFTYHRPQDLGAALELLDYYGDECKVLAGGVSLVPLMNMRLARPSHLLDIGRLKELEGIRIVDSHLHIGALVRHYRLVEDPQVVRCLPLLREAGEQIGHTAIRSRGTFGGSIAHADPAAEWPLCAVALDAVVHLRSAVAGRSVPIADFLLSYYMTTMDPRELLTGVVIPIPPQGCGWAFREVARRPGDFALVACCVLLALEFGRISMARIALGSVGPVPLRAIAAEEMLVGHQPDDALFEAAAAQAAAASEPEDDLHASAALRRHLARELTAACLSTALARAVSGKEVHR